MLPSDIVFTLRLIIGKEYEIISREEIGNVHYLLTEGVAVYKFILSDLYN